MHSTWYMYSGVHVACTSKTSTLEYRYICTLEYNYKYTLEFWNFSEKYFFSSFSSSSLWFIIGLILLFLYILGRPGVDKTGPVWAQQVELNNKWFPHRLLTDATTHPLSEEASLMRPSSVTQMRYHRHSSRNQISYLHTNNSFDLHLLFFQYVWYVI